MLIGSLLQFLKRSLIGYKRTRLLRHSGRTSRYKSPE